MRIKLTDGAEGVRLPAWRPPQVVAQLTAEAKQAVTVVVSEQARALTATLTRGLSEIVNLRLHDVLTQEDRLLIAWAAELASADGIDGEEVNKLTADLARYRAQELVGRAPELAGGAADTGVLSLPRFAPAEEAQARAILFGLATSHGTLDAGFVNALLDPAVRTPGGVSLSFLQRIVTALPPGASESLADLDRTYARRDARATLTRALDRLGLPLAALAHPTDARVELGNVIMRERARLMTPQSAWQLPTHTTRNDRALLGLLYVSQEERGGDLRRVDDVAHALVVLRSLSMPRSQSGLPAQTSLAALPRPGALPSPTATPPSPTARPSQAPAAERALEQPSYAALPRSASGELSLTAVPRYAALPPGLEAVPLPSAGQASGSAAPRYAAPPGLEAVPLPSAGQASGSAAPRYAAPPGLEAVPLPSAGQASGSAAPSERASSAQPSRREASSRPAAQARLSARPSHVEHARSEARPAPHVQPDVMEPSAPLVSARDAEAQRTFGSAIQLAAKAAVAYRTVAPPRSNSVPPPAGAAPFTPPLRPEAPPAALFNLSQALGLSAWVADAHTQALRARRRRFVRRREADESIQGTAGARETPAEADHDPTQTARRHARWRRLLRRRLDRQRGAAGAY